MRPSRYNQGKYIAALALVVLVLAAFQGAGDNGFVFDDTAYVANNPRLQQGLTLASIRWAFTTFYQANWHPLTWVSHLIDVSLFGLRPRGHHLTSVLLHAVNAVLLCWCLHRFSGSLWKSALTAALFAVHPLRLESVAWVAERKDVLAAAFCFLCLLAYLSYVRHPRPGKYAVLVAVYTAGLLAKPMLVTVPFVLILLDFWPLGRLSMPSPGSRVAAQRRIPRFPWHLVREKLPLAVIAFAFSIVTVVAQERTGAIKGLATYPVGVRVANALWSYVVYVKMLFPPWDLAVLYPHPALGQIPWGVAVLLLAAVSLLSWRLRRQAPYLITGWLLYLGMLLPVIGIVQVGNQGLADRYTYLPSLGLLIALLWGGAAVLARARFGQPAGVVLAAVVSCYLAGVTREQVRHWKSDETLYRRALAVTRDNWFMEFNLGKDLFDRDRLEEALVHYANAVRIRPGFAKAHNNLGATLLALGRRAEAIAAYREAVRHEPGLAEARSNLGGLLLEQGEIDAAVEHLEEAVRLDASFALDHLELARALTLRKRFAEALAHFREAFRLDPALRVETLAGAGYVSLGQGRWAEARSLFSEALALRPNDPTTLAGYARAGEGLRNGP